MPRDSRTPGPGGRLGRRCGTTRSRRRRRTRPAGTSSSAIWLACAVIAARLVGQVLRAAGHGQADLHGGPAEPDRGGPGGAVHQVRVAGADGAGAPGPRSSGSRSRRPARRRCPRSGGSRGGRGGRRCPARRRGSSSRRPRRRPARRPGGPAAAGRRRPARGRCAAARSSRAARSRGGRAAPAGRRRAARRTRSSSAIRRCGTVSPGPQRDPGATELAGGGDDEHGARAGVGQPAQRDPGEDRLVVRVGVQGEDGVPAQIGSGDPGDIADGEGPPGAAGRTGGGVSCDSSDNTPDSSEPRARGRSGPSRRDIVPDRGSRGPAGRFSSRRWARSASGSRARCRR